MIQLVIRELTLIRPIFYLMYSATALILLRLAMTDGYVNMGAILYVFILSFFCVISLSQSDREQPSTRFLAQSLPVWRKQLVGARFLVSIPVLAISFIIYIITGAVISFINIGITVSMLSWQDVVVICLLHFVASSIYHMMYYRFGYYVSGVFGMFIILFSCSFMFGVLVGTGLMQECLFLFSQPLYLLGMLAVTGLIIGFSYLLCVRLYEKYRS
ncbi:ABC-2 transporter permease [Bacillus sp. FJAT-52991]|uniref:ABC-2 transporter permease n=1 Tax=Bacillus kandeliae TaxID=3129297 RepID=A0ABZ2N5C8_9BACI